jgi:hypothetical protein
VSYKISNRSFFLYVHNFYFNRGLDANALE